MSRKLVCFTAYRTNLRAVAIIRCLEVDGFQVRLSAKVPFAGSVLELILSLIPNCWIALTSHADFAIGFKPHLNVTLPLLICKLRGIRSWIDIDDLDHAYRTGFLSKLVEWSQKPFPRFFDVISYHNPKLVKFIVDDLKCDSHKLISFPQGVDYKLFSKRLDVGFKEKMKSGLNLENRAIAIYTAHLNIASDLEPIIEAWKMVINQKPESLLMIVGGGSLLQYYKDRVKDLGIEKHIHFTGSVSQEQTQEYLMIADVALVYLSHRPVNACRCSLKLREYFAAGIKVVCNDFGELPEFREWTYQTTSSLEEYSKQILKNLSGYSDHREITAQGFAREKLDWAGIVSQVMSKQLSGYFQDNTPSTCL
jgi:glycosyltransferase involved in cell wall biosynthesis